MRLTDSELPRGDKRYQHIDIPVLQAQRLKEIKTQVENFIEDLRKYVGNESLTKPTTPQGIVLKYFNALAGQGRGNRQRSIAYLKLSV